MDNNNLFLKRKRDKFVHETSTNGSNSFENQQFRTISDNDADVEDEIKSLTNVEDNREKSFLFRSSPTVLHLNSNRKEVIFLNFLKLN
jgi:hypothetical protein